MKIQELVYSRPNLIGSVSTFGYMPASVSYLLFSFSNLCVYSVQCRQKVKLNNANVHSSIIVEHERKKESAYNYVCVQFSVSLCQWIHICVHMYVLVCVHQGVHICVTVSMCRQGVQAGSGGQLCACV